MKQYKLISLVICFVVLIVLSNPLVAQSKYRQGNPYNNSGQLNPYKTDRVDKDRASQYSKMQSKYINNEDSKINDFYNYNTGSVTYKTNLYDTDHFGRNDELGRKYDKFYDYEAGNPIYKKEVYNTDYFVRTDTFGNKYDKFYDVKSGSTSYGKDYRQLDYYNQTDEFDSRKEKYFNSDDGVYQYKRDLDSEREAREFKSNTISKKLNFENDDELRKLRGTRRDEYVKQKYENVIRENTDPKIYQNYNKTLLSQKNYDIDLKRDKIQKDNFYKYDRYGNKYDKFYETPVNKQRTDSNEFPTIQSKYNKEKYFRKNVEIQDKNKPYSKYSSKDKLRKDRTRPGQYSTKDQPDKHKIIIYDDDNYYDDWYYPYDYYRTRKYHPYRVYDPYYYYYDVKRYPRHHQRYYYPYRYHRRYNPDNYFDFYYNHGKWSFGLGLNIGYPYYYENYYDDYVYYDDNDYYYSRQGDNNDYYKDRYYVGLDKFDARKYSEKSKPSLGVEKGEKTFTPFKESLKKKLVDE